MAKDTKPSVPEQAVDEAPAEIPANTFGRGPITRTAQEQNAHEELVELIKRENQFFWRTFPDHETRKVSREDYSRAQVARYEIEQLRRQETAETVRAEMAPPRPLRREGPSEQLIEELKRELAQNQRQVTFPGENDPAPPPKANPHEAEVAAILAKRKVPPGWKL